MECINKEVWDAGLFQRFNSVSPEDNEQHMHQRSEYVWPSNEPICSIPIAWIADSLIGIEALARTLLGDESCDHSTDTPQVSISYNVESDQDGTYSIKAIADSLFDALVLQTLSLACYDSNEIRFCKCCGKAFMPKQGKQLYCLDPCNKGMASKRRIRAKAKVAQGNEPAK